MKKLLAALLLSLAVSCEAPLNGEARAPSFVLDLPNDVQSWSTDRPSHSVAFGTGIKFEVRSRLSPDLKTWVATVEATIRDTDGLALADTTTLPNGTLFKCDSTLTGNRVYSLATWANGYGFVAVCAANEKREAECVRVLSSFTVLR
jgi:hypothetical protein